jgi:hypothetical protein
LLLSETLSTESLNALYSVREPGVGNGRESFARGLHASLDDKAVGSKERRAGWVALDNHEGEAKPTHGPKLLTTRAGAARLGGDAGNYLVLPPALRFRNGAP